MSITKNGTDYPQAGFPMGTRHSLVKSITAAANAGDQLLATCTGTVMVHSCSIRAGGANADLLTAPVLGGPATETSVIVNATEAVKADLDADGNIISTFTSLSAGSKVDVPVYLKTAETVVCAMTGGGPTAVALEFEIEWSPLAAGSYLA